MSRGRFARWLVLAAVAAVGPVGCAALEAAFRSEPTPEERPGALGDEVARTLPSGLAVIAQRARAASVVAFELVVAVGSADDPPDRPGVARALDHAIVAGSSLSAIVAANGGRTEAWTTTDETHVAVVVPVSAFEETLAALGRAALEPRLAPDEVDRQIGAMVAEIRQSRTSAGRLALETLVGIAFDGSAWARSPIGSPEALARLRAEDLRRFHRARWVPRRMTLAIAGDVDAEEAIEATGRAFVGARRGPLPEARRGAPPSLGEPKIEVRGDRVRDAWIAIGFRTEDASAEELAALQLAAMLLGGTEDARVPGALEEASLGRGDPGEVGATLHVTRRPALLLVWAHADGSRGPAALEAMLVEAYRLGHAPVAASELATARRALARADAQGRDGMAGLAHTLAERATQPRLTLSRDTARRGGVDAAHLQRAAARMLVPERTVAVAIVPEAGLAAARRALAESVERAQRRAQRRSAAGERTTLAGGVVREVLGNGVRVLLAEDRRTPSVAVRLALVGGARIENDSSAGSSALLARLMARAASTKAPAAARVAPFAGRDTFGIEGSFAASELDVGLAALAHGLRAPALGPTAIEDERRALGIVQRDARANPMAAALARLAKSIFGTHPYAGDPTGTPEGLAGLDGPRLSAFHAQALAADRLAVAVTGDVAVGRVLSRARALFGGLPHGGTPPLAADPDGVADDSPLVVDGRWTVVAVGLPGTKCGDSDRAAIDVAVSVLDGRTGRLTRALVDRGLAVGAFARHVSGAIGGQVELGATVAAQNAAEARAAILAEVARLRTQRIGDAELARARGAAAGRAALAVDELGERAAALAFEELAAADASAVARAPERLRAVTADEILRAVARRWPADRERVVVAGPEPPD